MIEIMNASIMICFKERVKIDFSTEALIINKAVILIVNNAFSLHLIQLRKSFKEDSAPASKSIASASEANNKRLVRRIVIKIRTFLRLEAINKGWDFISRLKVV
jgi:hypothetical protein